MNSALARWVVFNILDAMEKVNVKGIMDKVVQTWKIGHMYLNILSISGKYQRRSVRVQKFEIH